MAIRSRTLALVATLLALGVASFAHAQDTPQTPVPPRRAVPDLDGRPPSDANDVADGFLWIPRILTGPIYLVTEYVIRAPLNALLYEVERAGIVDWLLQTGSPVTILPTFFIEFGTSPSAGLYLRLDGLPFAESHLSVHAATWGQDWLRLAARERIAARPDLDIGARFEAIRRPDQILQGLGYDGTQSQRARFGVERIDARFEMAQRPWRRSELRYQAGYRSAGFFDSNWNGDPSVSERGAPPTGYTQGYQLAYGRAEVTIDTRSSGGELPRSFFRLRALGELNGVFGSLTPGDPTRRVSAFVRWGGEIVGATDVLGLGRLLSLRVRSELVTPLTAGSVIPFYELPDAGGIGPVPGFITGQLRGMSVIGATLEYTWPVHALLDGTLSMTIGNAFGAQLSDFAWERLRLGWQIGIAPRFAGEHLFEITVAIGTETFERGTDVSQVRFVVGTRDGL